MTDRPPASGPAPRPDPVRVRRAQVARLVSVVQRIGYLLFAVACFVFVYGFVKGFTGVTAGIIMFGLVAGSVLLAPAIVLGYGVKKAEREDTGTTR
jgi:hypothetical protein